MHSTEKFTDSHVHEFLYNYGRQLIAVRWVFYAFPEGYRINFKLPVVERLLDFGFISLVHFSSTPYSVSQKIPPVVF